MEGIRMPEISRRGLLKAGLGTAAGVAALSMGGRLPALAVSTPSNKVVRSGTDLLLNGKPHRMVGFDIWPAAINSGWNRPPNFEYALNYGHRLKRWLEQIHDTAPDLNTVRVWFFQQFAVRDGARDWSAIEKVLRVCDSEGFKVIATLEDGWGYEGTGDKDAAWFASGYKSAVLPHETVPYKHWVREIVTQYAADPRIAVWELVNELDLLVSASDLTGFISDVSGMIKTIDSHTPVGTGEAGTLTSTQYRIPTLDVASYHYYSVYKATNFQGTASLAYAAGLPTYIGEMGIPASVGLSARASTMSTLLPTVFATKGMAGFVMWQYAESGGDQFNVKAGDPVLPILNRYVK
jgi:endo-1,4-beta-mannosidase